MVKGIKRRKRGGPSVKSSEPIFCFHCFENGSNRETAATIKKNLPRHNKRWQSELDPVKDQAWMLVWTQGASSAVRNNAITSFLRPRTPRRSTPRPQPQTPIIIKKEPETMIKIEPEPSQSFTVLTAASLVSDKDKDTPAPVRTR